MPKILGQIFYGRAPGGYGVLGSSPAGRSFIGAVAAICRAVGSPDRPGDVRPFLLSKREGAAVLMIRACRGAADPTGRATIFFHALVADKASLRAAGLNAFVLENAGVFAESCPSREPPDLTFPSAKQHEATPAEGRGIDMPATISSERPLDELVRQEMGVKSLDLNWATFTFNPLPDFDLCVLSSYSPRKGTGTQYAFDDAGLHRLSSEPAKKEPAGGGTLPVARSSKRRSSLPLSLSLAVNMVLVFVFLLHGGNGDGGKPEENPTGVEMTESDAREKWALKWKTEWEKSLPPPPPAMTEDEAKAQWEAKWKAGWEKSLPPAPHIMTEAEAKVKWEAKWKSEWEKSRPTIPSAMTEAEAKAKWEESWRTGWIQALRSDFTKFLSSSGGEWPIRFNNENSLFPSSVRSSLVEPDDEKLAQRWRIYRSCKTCADFIQAHLNP